MTLIVGLKCRDGVVLGSDGAATMGSLGAQTSRQPTDKITIIDNKVLVGVSGPVGLGQRFSYEIELLWSTPAFKQSHPIQAMLEVSGKMRSHITTEMNMAATASRVINPNIALSDALSTTVLALPLNDQAELFQFSQQGTPERSTENLPFVCIGSGEQIADPFIGFIRNIYWQNSCPTNIRDGIFAVYWTLSHSIALSPGGVAEPIQLTSLTKDRGVWKTKEHSPEELQDHKEHIKSVEAKLRELRATVQTQEGAQEIPEPTR
jgi:20S proteasome alpha/beta subunit